MRMASIIILLSFALFPGQLSIGKVGNAENARAGSDCLHKRSDGNVDCCSFASMGKVYGFYMDDCLADDCLVNYVGAVEGMDGGTEMSVVDDVWIAGCSELIGMIVAKSWLGAAGVCRAQIHSIKPRPKRISKKIQKIFTHMSPSKHPTAHCAFASLATVPARIEFQHKDGFANAA